MTDKILYWTSVVFSLLALLLFIANTSLVNGNRALQTQANDRQAEINRAASLTQLNQNLAQALAELSVKNKDGEIRKLLESQGITVNQQALKGAEAKEKKKPVPKNEENSDEE